MTSDYHIAAQTKCAHYAKQYSHSANRDL